MDLITPDALPADPIDALRELVRCEGEIERLRRERIKEARSAGASWKQVGEVLGMTSRSGMATARFPVGRAGAAFRIERPSGGAF